MKWSKCATGQRKEQGSQLACWQRQRVEKYMKAEDGREKQGGKRRGISKDYDCFTVFDKCK